MFKQRGTLAIKVAVDRDLAFPGKQQVSSPECRCRNSIEPMAFMS
jgi:hypothetical protein